jgi:glycerate kinase
MGADIAGGARTVFDLIGLSETLSKADLVITGEGSLDRQTLWGKGPAAVAELARRHQVPTVAIAGRNTLSSDELSAAGILEAFTLTSIEPDEERCMASTELLLRMLAIQAGPRMRAHAERWSTPQDI